MKVTKPKICMYWILLFIILFSGCKKEWLDAKPNKALVVPSTVADYQALLDDNSTMNYNQPSLTIIADGDFYVTDTRYAALSKTEKSVYRWAANADDFYTVSTVDDWTMAYARILFDNIVLDGLKSLKIGNSSSLADYNNTKGSALFYRSFDFYNLCQEFCKQYNSSTSNSDLGLPLRLSSNINETINRSSLQQTYDQIIADLETAASLLPPKPAYSTRPSKAAVFGLLSRVYLSQRKYDKSLLYADSCLQIQNKLMNFNDLTATASYPISRTNEEVIYSSATLTYFSFLSTRLIIDPALYQSYVSDDLRTLIYFSTVAGNKSFKGSYEGFNFFNGLATDELYLTRAECYARSENTIKALDDLNTLLKTRWKSGKYINITAANSTEALEIILKERRKELCFRNLRWTDLRRLNTESRFQTTLTRNIAGIIYTLEPNSSRYVLPLDNNQLILGGLQQNPR